MMDIVVIDKINQFNKSSRHELVDIAPHFCEMKLPLELMEYVVDYTDRLTTLNLGYTCKPLNCLVTRKLMKSILVMNTSSRFNSGFRRLRYTTSSSISQRKFYDKYTLISRQRFMNLVANSQLLRKYTDLIVFEDREIESDFLETLSNALPKTQILVLDDYRTFHHNGLKTLQIKLINELHDSQIAYIKNLLIDGRHFNGHNPEVQLPSCNYNRLCIRNNQHFRLSSNTGEKIKVKSLIVEGNFDISLSTLIDKSSVKQLHLRLNHSSFDLQEFLNLDDLSLDINWCKRPGEKIVTNLKENTLRFLRIISADQPHIEGWEDCRNLSFSQKLSLEQLVFLETHWIFWYEITAIISHTYELGYCYPEPTVFNTTASCICDDFGSMKLYNTNDADSVAKIDVYEDRFPGISEFPRLTHFTFLHTHYCLPSSH